MMDRYDGRTLMDFIQDPSRRKRPPSLGEKQIEMMEACDWTSALQWKGVMMCRVVGGFRGLSRFDPDEESGTARGGSAAAGRKRKRGDACGCQSCGDSGNRTSILRIQWCPDSIQYFIWYARMPIRSGIAVWRLGLMAVYGTTAALLEDGPSSESEESESETPTHRGKKPGRSLNRNLLDRIGREDFGLPNFCHKLKRVMKMEGETSALKELRFSRFHTRPVTSLWLRDANRPQRMSRKKHAERARRMAGQGLHPDATPRRCQRGGRQSPTALPKSCLPDTNPICKE